MQSSTTVPSANSSSAAATAASRTSRSSDDEILGLTSEVTNAPASTGSAQPTNAGVLDPNAPPAVPEQFRAIFDANPSLRDAWRESQAFREIFPDLESAREIQKLFPTADDARAARTQIGDLAKLDALFFSNRPESHAELAAAVYRLNPAAFRSLARMMQSISAGEPNSGGQAVSPAATRVASNADASTATEVFAAAPNVAIPAAQQTFLHEANAAAVTGVIDAIHSQVERLLPSGTADGAKRRIVGEIYREIDASLRANPSYIQQLRQAVRAGSSSPENRQAIAGMVMARARQALPAIAKRVINEWTSGVVAHSNARLDRQRSAERRVDIAGGSPGGDGPRALMPRDLDYRRLSDADILNM